ncbi:hypothetical protein BAPA111461_25560 [Bacillus paramycoides]
MLHLANGLSTPLHNFWKNNPFRMLHDYNPEVYIPLKNGKS